VPLALFFAMMIHRGVWGAGAFRLILLFPNLLGGIAATLIWLSAYQPHGGLVNAGLAGLGTPCTGLALLVRRLCVAFGGASLCGADPDLHLDGLRV